MWRSCQGSAPPPSQPVLLFTLNAATKLPAYQGDELAQAKSRFSEILEQANSFSASAAERIKEIEQELKDIEMEKERIATVTVDEELAADPKLAAEIDAENEKNSFLVTP